MKPLFLHISTARAAEYNLALEEYLLTQTQADVLLFYINEDAVVIGKHQNPWQEVNIPYCKTNGIQIIRRLSGGGTVFHDKNNINFSFIRSKETDFVNFREHIEPLSRALKVMGIDNQITARNDLFKDGKKFSGNAEHVNNSKKRILHHGTLLFDSDLTKLRAALRPAVTGIRTHAVDSVRSKVTCLKEHSTFQSTGDFLDRLSKELRSELELKDGLPPQANMAQIIEKLIDEKYLRWDWNYGHTPQFTYAFGPEEIITVRKGRIVDISSTKLTKPQKELLLEQWYHPERLLRVLGPKHQELIERISIAI